ncbi:MAG: alanine/glycine:cation symporter family protein [Thermoplasmata archaeon]|nr:alanine/glycine:cation symporter family protein [Thermoplasmata archaeon]
MVTRTDVEELLSTTCEYAWVVALFFMIGIGAYFFIKLKGTQIIRIRESLDLSRENILAGRAKSTVSSFETFCLTLGTRVGVGNIAGMSTAIVSGGPGAIFWIWVFGIIGSANSFMESTLAQIFKEKKSDGHFYSGPAYYVRKGLGKRRLAIAMAVLIIVLEVGFMGYQSSSAVSALEMAFPFEGNSWFFALLLTIGVAPVIFGGMKHIAKVMAHIVPVMALFWIVVCAIVIGLNSSGLGNAFDLIFAYAFDMQALGGGLIGSAVIHGLNRGVFASEAGLGTVASLAGAADVSHPVKQGMVQSLATLVDSLIICTATGLVLLSFFPDYASVIATGLNQTQLVEYVIQSTIGTWPGAVVFSVFVLLFAYTTIIGNYSMAESNLRFLHDDHRAVRRLRVITLILLFLSCTVVGVQAMNDISDIIKAGVGCVNIVVVLLLCKFAFQAYNDWKLQRLRGVKNPVFHQYALEDHSGVTEWK